MDTTTAGSDRTQIITLEGDLTLPRARDIAGMVRSALDKSDDISLRFGDVRSADLSCLQVLCSGHRSAMRSKKRMSFGSAVPRVFREAMDRAGYARLQGCKLECDSNCLWTAGQQIVCKQ